METKIKTIGLNSNQLKILAMLFMTVDHIGAFLLPQYEILRYIGRLAMPIFAFMIAEGCTHRRQCGDIGTEKIPNLLRKKTGKEVEISFFSGQEYPDDLEKYRMIIHCGGCMLNAREMKARITMAEDRGVPITNYGMILAYFSGILERSLRVFPQYHAMLDE